MKVAGKPGIRDRFKALWKRGISYEQMAWILRVNADTLYEWRKELGLPRRKRGRRKMQ